MIEGLEYAFPRRMKKLRPRKLLENRYRVRIRLEKYLASQRRIAFNQMGIFRHYAELDA
jgi:glutathione S-transferase